MLTTLWAWKQTYRWMLKTHSWEDKVGLVVKEERKVRNIVGSNSFNLLTKANN